MILVLDWQPLIFFLSNKRIGENFRKYSKLKKIGGSPCDFWMCGGCCRCWNLCRLILFGCVWGVLHSREDHLHRNECFASDGPAWLGGPGQEVHLRFLSAAGQRALPRQEAAAWGWVATIDCSEIIDTLSASFVSVKVSVLYICRYCISSEKHRKDCKGKQMDQTACGCKYQSISTNRLIV